MDVIGHAHELLIRVLEKMGGGFLNSVPTDIWSSMYTKYLRAAGASIGSGSRVHRRVYVRYPRNIVIGDRVMIPASTDMAGMGPISIGDDTLIGAGVRFITNHHPLKDNAGTNEKRARGTQSAISIGKGCWIMNNSLLVAGRAGLNVGDRAWIAAGAVVTKNVAPDSVVGGVPARPLSRR